MTTNAAESYMRGWSFAASGQLGDDGCADPNHERGRAAGRAALGCVAGLSSSYRDGWKDGARGAVQPAGTGAYKLGAAHGEAARLAAQAVAQKLA